MRRESEKHHSHSFPVRFFFLLFLCASILSFVSFSEFRDHKVAADSAQDDPQFLPVIFRESTLENPSNLNYGVWSKLIAVSSNGTDIWVVNPDSGSVTVIDGELHQKTIEIGVGGEPWSLDISSSGEEVYLIDRAGGRLILIDGQLFEVEKSVTVGAEPISILLDPVRGQGYISLGSAGQLLIFDSKTLAIKNQIDLPPHPYGLAIANDQLLITHFLSQTKAGGEEARDDGREGIISVIDLETEEVVDQIKLPPNQNGFPSLMPTISTFGNRAWIPHLRASPDLPNGLTEIVFAAVSAIDLNEQEEWVEAFLPLNDQDIFGSPINNPWAAIPSPNGKTLYVVAAGSDLVEAIDIREPSSPKLIGFLPTGRNPRGMAISADGKFGYVMNYLSRSVTVLDLEQFEAMAEIEVSDEPLSADLLTGKILFNSAANPKMSRASWVSCASCHPDGGTDGVTWMFPDGPRQTPPIWNAAETLPWHWSAALDEMHDVEDTIQLIQHGIGLAPGGDSAPLQIKHAGKSNELDALALFMASGIRIPNVEPEKAEKSQLDQGRALFKAAGCASCHGGATWTTSKLPESTGPFDPDQNGMIDSVLHDVGTLDPRDIKGETGFDIPSLLNIGLTAPYFHNGSMETLENVVKSGHPNREGGNRDYTEAELDALITFLTSIGTETLPIER